MSDMKGRQAEINSAAAHQPKSGHRKPAGRKSGSAVGNETSADMKGAMDGTPMDNYPLRGR